jgi:hypothetical protein
VIDCVLKYEQGKSLRLVSVYLICNMCMFPHSCFSGSFFVTRCRPYGRLWWDEVVGTVLTCPNARMQVSCNPWFCLYPFFHFASDFNICAYVLLSGLNTSCTRQTTNYSWKRSFARFSWQLQVSWNSQRQVFLFLKRILNSCHIPGSKIVSVLPISLWLGIFTTKRRNLPFATVR